jgi:hypothetical protein
MTDYNVRVFGVMRQNRTALELDVDCTCNYAITRVRAYPQTSLCATRRVAQFSFICVQFFEHELHDNDISAREVKVMDHYWLIILRFFICADGVIFRVRETW